MWLFAPLALIVLVLVLRILLFRGPYAEPTVDLPSGIIDMHCHTAGIGAGGSGAEISEALRKSWKFHVYLKIFGTNRRTLEAEGDASLLKAIAISIRESKYVEGAVILAMDAVYDADGKALMDKTEVFVPNRFVGESVKEHPELFFGASVHPNRTDALSELEWSKRNGAVFIKWLPNIQGIDASNDRYKPYYEKLVELDLPLLIHVGDEDSFSTTDNSLGDPKRLELPLSCGARVIAAHVASSGRSEGQCNVERLLELMQTYPNLVADVSTLTQFNRCKHLAKVLTDSRLKGRLMYGTDFPLTNTPMVTPLQYPLRLTLKQLWRLSRVSNSWDKDVQLKAALGLPREVFEMSRKYLKL